MLRNKLILVKGAGDFASGSIRRLHLAGAKVVCTELPQPLTIRRKAAFSEAMYSNEHSVEGITAVKAEPEEIEQYLEENKIPIIVDPEANVLKAHNFEIVIDARMAKRNLGTRITDAPIVIALGPGFEAGTDCHAIVETLAGHNLGRVIYSGKAAANTGTPAPPEFYLNPCSSLLTPCGSGFDVNTLVIRAPDEGVFSGIKQIGEVVKKGEVIGRVKNIDILATADGVLRGIIYDGVTVSKGLKIGDIDPTGDISRVNQISEKSNAIAGGVLEACLYLLNKG